MKKIVLTGGGTAGHVSPNMALVPELEKRGYQILYIGGKNGMEQELVQNNGLDFRGISTGKLRRYFDLRNFTDPFRVIKGFFEARQILREFGPDVVFSKGGFVAVPVTLAARSLCITVIEHESDMTPGLANRISAPAAKKICVSFPETLEYVKSSKGVLTGLPIRQELLTGSRDEGLGILGFEGEKPVLLIIGGSLGAEHINVAVRGILPRLLPDFDICHITGKGHMVEELSKESGYRQFEYVDAELRHFFAAADIFVSRAGANVIFEILSLKKPALLIPLSARASRGDQLLNAESFRKSGYSLVLEEEDMTDESLYESISRVWEERETLVEAMAASGISDGVGPVISIIEENVG